VNWQNDAGKFFKTVLVQIADRDDWAIRRDISPIERLSTILLRWIGAQAPETSALLAHRR
jgi:hypothetical protein